MSRGQQGAPPLCGRCPLRAFCLLCCLPGAPLLCGLLPESQYEAARIDGAGVIQQFWYVTIPNIKNGLALCALLRTIDTFRLFEKVNILTGGGPAGTTSTITQYLYNYGIRNLKFGFGSAGAIVMTLLVLILASAYIKRAIK